jgi:hypothetical protein
VRFVSSSMKISMAVSFAAVKQYVKVAQPFKVGIKEATTSVRRRATGNTGVVSKRHLRYIDVLEKEKRNQVTL